MHKLRCSSRLGGILLCLTSIVLAALLAGPVAADPDTQGDDRVDESVLREKYEWSNIWWDCANDDSLPRVLLIGDSISCGYSPKVTKLLAGKAHVDRLGTSRSINDPVLLKETAMMLEEYDYAAIHFNNGLHGFHLEGPAYAAALGEYVRLLQKLGGGAPLIWASSTPITERDHVDVLAENNEKVTARNALAAEIMKAQEIPTSDLYQVVVGKPELRSEDGYHYNGQGYDVLAKAVADAVLPYIK